jgi:hypothetical protein
MTSRLIASGDSFIVGTDLADATEIGHSLQTWPSLIANYSSVQFFSSSPQCFFKIIKITSPS